MNEARIRGVEPPYRPAIEEAFARLMPKGVPPLELFRAVARNERVFLRMVAGGLLDRGTLSMREREIVIDRTCFRCGAEYEWGVHVAFFGGRVGFTEAEIAGLATDAPEATPFTSSEQLLLRLCDELHATSNVTDGLWRELRAVYSEEQLIELVMLAGYYHAISFATNALRVPLEVFAARFPKAAGETTL